MKKVRWITFLPLAIAGGLAVNYVLTIGWALLPFLTAYAVGSWFVLSVTGAAFSGALFAIGFRVVPAVNNRSKWLLCATPLLLAVTGIAGAFITRDVEAVATCVGMLVGALPLLNRSPEQLEKWFRATPSPLVV